MLTARLADLEAEEARRGDAPLPAGPRDPGKTAEYAALALLRRIPDETQVQGKPPLGEAAELLLRRAKIEPALLRDELTLEALAELLTQAIHPNDPLAGSLIQDRAAAAGEIKEILGTLPEMPDLTSFLRWQVEGPHNQTLKVMLDTTPWRLRGR